MRSALLLLVVITACAAVSPPEDVGPPKYSGNLREDFDLIRSEYKLGIYDCTDQAQVLRDYLLSYGHIEQPKELFYVIGEAHEPVIWHEQEGIRYPDFSHVWVEYWHIKYTEVISGPMRGVTETRIYIVYDPLRNVCGKVRIPYYRSDEGGGMEKRRMKRASAILTEVTDFGYRDRGDRYWQGNWYRVDGTKRER